MMHNQSANAVLLLAYGGPESLHDVPAYLRDISGGCETRPDLIDAVTHRYERIGGSSPLLAITQAAAGRLSARADLPVYVGMRHWHPFIESVVAQMATDGVQHAVVICMAPHYSGLSIGAYRQKLDDALRSLPRDGEGRVFDVTFVEAWGEQQDYVKGVAANVRAALHRIPAEKRSDVRILFTAHSLPASILERGDPYPDQLAATARLVAERLHLSSERWQLCYQSASTTGTPWLGPRVDEMVANLAANGHRQFVVAAIGFLADHLEVLYDLDIDLQQRARDLGVQVERAPSLNDGDALISALMSLVHAHLPEAARVAVRPS